METPMSVFNRVRALSWAAEGGVVQISDREFSKMRGLDPRDFDSKEWGKEIVREIVFGLWEYNRAPLENSSA